MQSTLGYSPSISSSNIMGMLACLENTLPNLYLIKHWSTVGIWISLEDFAINIKLMLFLFFFQLGYDESNLLPIKLQLVWWCDVIHLYVWANAGYVSSLVSKINKKLHHDSSSTTMDKFCGQLEMYYSYETN